MKKSYRFNGFNVTALLPTSQLTSNSNIEVASHHHVFKGQHSAVLYCMTRIAPFGVRQTEDLKVFGSIPGFVSESVDS